MLIICIFNSQRIIRLIPLFLSIYTINNSNESCQLAQRIWWKRKDWEQITIYKCKREIRVLVLSRFNFGFGKFPSACSGFQIIVINDMLFCFNQFSLAQLVRKKNFIILLMYYNQGRIYIGTSIRHDPCKKKKIIV